MTIHNLRYLESGWLLTAPASAALRNFGEFSDARLIHLLRHHDETEDGISDEETVLRDEFDYLLGFYSIIEIAAMIGFVKKLPESFKTIHLKILSHVAVRRYYEQYYPIALPRRLRERMTSKVAYRVRSDSGITAAFFEFLELTKVIERDEDVESFLWPLDGGTREDESSVTDASTVLRALKDPKRLVHALQTPPRDRSELDRALNGFSKFMQFCEQLVSLIKRFEGSPDFAEALWLAHAYWFDQLDSHFGSELKKALRSLAKWKVEDPEEANEVTERVAELEAVVRELADPEFRGIPSRKIRVIAGPTLVTAITGEIESRLKLTDS